MQKRKIGILTFSDGRKFAHDLQYKMNKGFQDKLVKVLKATGVYALTVEEMSGKFKFAQNKSKEDRQKIAGFLKERGTPLDLQVSLEIQKTLE